MRIGNSLAEARRDAAHRALARKRAILFMLAVSAAIACMMAAMGGERLLKAFRVGRTPPGAASCLILRPKVVNPPPAPVRPSDQHHGYQAVTLDEGSDEFDRRASGHGGHTGEIQITLLWHNTNDIDLHVDPPDGPEIYYDHMMTGAGWLDVDMNAADEFSTEPVENIVWPRGEAPAGRYSVRVYHYANHGGHDPTSYEVKVKINNTERLFRGQLESPDDNDLVYEFDYSPPADRRPSPQAAVTHQPRQVESQPRTPVDTHVDRDNGLPDHFWYYVLVVATWTALISLCLALALILAQSLFKKRLLHPTPGTGKALVATPMLGFAAGGIAQMTYGLLAGSSDCQPYDLALGWLILGGLLAVGMSRIVPNLPPTRAALAGVAGGVIGSAAYGGCMRLFSDCAGREAGAVLVGSAIALAVLITVAATPIFRVPTYAVRPESVRLTSGVRVARYRTSKVIVRTS